MLPPLARLATHSLGQDVIEWCLARRQAVPPPSFQTLADELNGQYGVGVHEETLRRWVSTLGPKDGVA